MFPQEADYEAAVIGQFPTHSPESRPAWKWAAEKTAELGGPVAVVVPDRGSFRDDPVLKSLPDAMIKATWRTLSEAGRAHVVVAFWPNAKTLEELDCLPNLRALAVVPLREDDVAVWRDARRAVDLVTSVRAEPELLDDPVAEAALSSLTLRVNLSSGLSHPDDRAAAVACLRILHAAGHQLDGPKISVWAMTHGWRADTARELAEYAEGVADNRSYRGRGTAGWAPDILDQWQATASSEAVSANEERVDAFWQRLVDNGAIDLAEVAERNEVDEGTIRKWSGTRLVVVRLEGRELVPAFLLDDNMSPKPSFEPIVSELSGFLSPRDAWAWLGAPATLLSGEVPAEVVARNPERVLRAARSYGAQLSD